MILYRAATLSPWVVLSIALVPNNLSQISTISISKISANFYIPRMRPEGSELLELTENDENIYRIIKSGLIYYSTYLAETNWLMQFTKNISYKAWFCCSTNTQHLHEILPSFLPFTWYKNTDEMMVNIIENLPFRSLLLIRTWSPGLFSYFGEF